MEQRLSTPGQLERNLSQSIIKLYRQQLKHSPSKVTCQLFGNQVAIVIEDAITAVEKTLAETANQLEIVNQLNLAINHVIKSKLKILIEEVLEVKVQDILFDSNLATCRTGAIAILDQPPQVRNPESIPKNYNHQAQKTLKIFDNKDSSEITC